MKMYPSFPNRLSSSSVIDVRDMMYIMIICFSIGVDPVYCQHFCKVGEITSDVNGEVNGANIDAMLTDQQCVTTTTPLPTTTVKPATTTTPSSSVTPPVTKANSSAPPTNSSSPAPPTKASSPAPPTNSPSPAPSTKASSPAPPTNSPSPAPTTKASSTAPPNLTTTVAPMTSASPLPTTVSTTAPSPSTNNSSNANTTCINATSCNNMTAGNSSAGSLAAPRNDSQPSVPPVTSSTQTPGHSTSAATTTPLAGRKRREDPATVSNATACQITVSSADGQKLTTGSAWRASFSCSRDETKCSSVDGAGDSAANKTYCCTGNYCNNVTLLQQKQHLKYSTVKSCYSGSTDAVPAVCDATSKVCATVTRADGNVSYQCGTQNISRICEQPEEYEGIPQKGCYQPGKQSEDIVLVCCCGTDNCNSGQGLQMSTYSNDAKLVGGIVVAFLVGLLIGGVAVSCWKRKKNGSARPGDLLSFNYKRMSADELQEEIDLG